MTAFGKGVWLHSMPNTARECDRIVNQLADAGFDLLIPCVKYMDGVLEYPSAIGPVREGYETFDSLDAMCRTAERRGLKLHPWFCVFCEGERTPIVQADRRVLCLTPDGETAGAHGVKGNEFVCPRQEAVRAYELALYAEVLDRYPVEGVHMDYIRYHGRDVCFCETCRQAFEREFGEDILHMLNALEHAVYAPALDWRAKPVTDFVRALREETAKRGKELSAAVFTSYPSCWSAQGQDWWTWAREGLVDFLFPMNYEAAPAQAEAYALHHRALVRPPVALWEGLRRFKWAEPGAFAAMARRMRASGADGVVAFHYPAMSDEDIRETGKL